MRRVVRATVVAILATALGAAATISAAAASAAHALFVGSTFYSDPRPSYMQKMAQSYLRPFYPEPEAYVSVHTPAQFWPVRQTDEYTLDESVRVGAASLMDAIAAQPAGRALIVNGYSQGTRVASIAKQNLIAQYGDSFEAYPDISFVLVSNINKPNGGVLSRGAILGEAFPITIPFLGITFGGATPTNSPVTPGDSGDHALNTKDITVIHDAVSDAPVYLNPLTLANALLGMNLHNYEPLVRPKLVYQGSRGDTDYYVIGTDIVPILFPLADLGISRPVLLALDEPLRVLIEATGYRRDVNPGEPTPFGIVPVLNPVVLAVNLMVSVAVGLDDAFEDTGHGRPLGTAPSGPYGVGGPSLPDPPPSRPEPGDDSGVSEPVMSQPDSALSPDLPAPASSHQSDPASADSASRTPSGSHAPNAQGAERPKIAADGDPLAHDAPGEGAPQVGDGRTVAEAVGGVPDTGATDPAGASSDTRADTAARAGAGSGVTPSSVGDARTGGADTTASFRAVSPASSRSRSRSAATAASGAGGGSAGAHTGAGTAGAGSDAA